MTKDITAPSDSDPTPDPFKEYEAEVENQMHFMTDGEVDSMDDIEDYDTAGAFEDGAPAHDCAEAALLNSGFKFT